MRFQILNDFEIQDAENLFREIERSADHTERKEKKQEIQHFPKTLQTSCFLGAYKSDLIGFLAYTPDCFALQYSGVRKEESGKGVATALLKELVKIAEQAGAWRLTVCAKRQVLPLFRSFGFEAEGEKFEKDGSLFVPMEYMLGQHWLGQTVHVSIELPLGSYHPLYPDVQVTCNKGIVIESLKNEMIIEAYVVDLDEAAEEAEGKVIGIVYHHDALPGRLLVAEGTHFSHASIIDRIAFEEQYTEMRILWDTDH